MSDVQIVVRTEGRDERRTVTTGTTAADLFGDDRRVVVARVNDGLRDLAHELADGDVVEPVTVDSEDGLNVLRHSAAHVLAQAVQEINPKARLGIGPPVRDGFYYDFDVAEPFTPEDLKSLEKVMQRIVKEGQTFRRRVVTDADAREELASEPYKLELIGLKSGPSDVPSADGGDSTSEAEVEAAAEGASVEVGGGELTIYDNLRRDGSVAWKDLCRGPHLPSTRLLANGFQLMRTAAAYWRGSEKNPQLQRVYGTAWPTKDELKAHLERLAEAERRDHRRLGAELDLFSFPEELGGGLAVWHPKGAKVRRIIEDYSRDEHDANGYELAFTPHIAKSLLWEISGHLDFYAEGMYPPMEMEGATYYPKPMNCPFHLLIYRSRQRSYRELPMRIFELGTVYRFERSGVLHGLLRARGFTQDDSHIFCTPDQLDGELQSLLAFVVRLLRTFGFTEFEAALATKPAEKSVGEQADWDRATDALEAAIKAVDLPYEVDEGGGAFYGPKIDVHVRDAIGRKWQLSTLQVDFQEPQRFGLEFTGADNQRHQPIMIHRALFGSVERFFGILVEHYAGAFPLWLAPEQVRVLPVRDDHDAYATRIADRLRADGFRADATDAAEPLGARIRRSKMEKIPYVLVVGDDDVANGTAGVNDRAGNVERGVPVDDFAARLRAEVDARVPS